MVADRFGYLLLLRIRDRIVTRSIQHSLLMMRPIWSFRILRLQGIAAKFGALAAADCSVRLRGPALSVAAPDLGRCRARRLDCAKLQAAAGLRR